MVYPFQSRDAIKNNIVFQKAQEHSCQSEEFPNTECRIIAKVARIVDAIMDSVEDLVSYQRELDQEEKFLTKLIAQIDEQINRLQVEQMELQSSMFDGGCTERMEIKPTIEPPEDGSGEQLILNVPVNIKSVIEQETEDEEDEEES